jgi:hypothetical protein
MISFISVSDGCIELIDHNGDWVATHRSPAVIAEAIMENGGPDRVIYMSSDWNFATEFGFDSQEELENIWDKVCSYL